jgi:hypothetical protein
MSSRDRFSAPDASPGDVFGTEDGIGTQKMPWRDRCTPLIAQTWPIEAEFPTLRSWRATTPGVSFRSGHDPAAPLTFTVVANTSDGAWPVASTIAALTE